MVLFCCDQCGYEEWRAADREPWLCAVCGGMRWGVVEQEPEEPDGGTASPACEG